ncbi:MAG: hypothetical protein LV481_10670 [Methylacidiphilales bacterium]|nr:hypothetical protein [Candidatus Methylacidiphilales bacterium]
MTAGQIIHEIEALPIEEQREVLSRLQKRFEDQEATAAKVTYADGGEVMRVADRIFTERADLFKKLAK